MGGIDRKRGLGHQLLIGTFMLLSWAGAQRTSGVECPEESRLHWGRGRTPGGSRGCEERVCLTGHEGCLRRVFAMLAQKWAFPASLM